MNTVAIRMGGFSGNIHDTIYFCIPHLEWYDVRDFVVHDWGLVSWKAVAGASVYGLLYSFLLLGVTWLIFRKKALTV